MPQAGWNAGQRVPYGYGYGGGGSEPGGGTRVGWSEDQTAAYLYDDQGRVTHRWIQGRPDISTFNPFTYGYGQGQAAQGGQMYNAWQGGGGAGGYPGGGAGGYPGGGGYDAAGGGDAGGYFQDPDRMAWDEYIRQFELTYEESVRAREEIQRRHDAEMAQRERELAQQLEIARMNIASAEGMQKYEWEQRFKQLEQEHQNAVEYLQLDWTERHKSLDKQIGQQLREMWSRERLAAAQMGAQPQNYRMYERWMAGLGGEADPSGLPAGAPAFQTAPGMEGAVAGGDVPGVSPYAQAYATGQRIPEFGEWGGSTAPIGGQPWVDPKDITLSQFQQSPWLSQQMQYGRWRERGLFPQEAQKRMYAAAPTGTAPAQVRYG